MARFPCAVAISLGNGADLAISENGILCIVEDADMDPVVIELGRATKQRFAALSSYLDRLSIHATDAS